MTLLQRQAGLMGALRRAHVPVSMVEGLDAARALELVGVADRELLRETLAATMIKRPVWRAVFDQLFDLYFPATYDLAELQGDTAGEAEFAAELQQLLGEVEQVEPGDDSAAALQDFQARLQQAWLSGDEAAIAGLAREAVTRFGLIRGRSPGQQRWSAYNVTQRVAPDELRAKLLAGLSGPSSTEAAQRRLIDQQARRFRYELTTEVNRRTAAARGPDQVAEYAVRPSIEQLSFTAARRDELAQLHRQLQPLVRKLATQLGRAQRRKQRGQRLDFRATMRASLARGGVPVDLVFRPRQPTKSELVVLCDVSGSVSHFAHFTLLLVHGLRQHFQRLRAFTFVDEAHEVTNLLEVKAAPEEVLANIADSISHASRWGRTDYGRSLERFLAKYSDALTPRTQLLILGDARSNYADNSIATLEQIVASVRQAWWLNPEHSRHWNTGDSVADEYSQVVPMVECRNLAQLTQFIGDLA